MKSQHQKHYKCLIGELKKARLSIGMTQLVAARALGKHAPFISKIESGERRIDVIELLILCSVYNVPLAKFLQDCEFI